MSKFFICECQEKGVDGYRFCGYHEWIESIIWLMKWSVFALVISSFGGILLMTTVGELLKVLPEWCTIYA